MKNTEWKNNVQVGKKYIKRRKQLKGKWEQKEEGEKKKRRWNYGRKEGREELRSVKREGENIRDSVGHISVLGHNHKETGLIWLAGPLYLTYLPTYLYTHTHTHYAWRRLLLSLPFLSHFLRLPTLFLETFFFSFPLLLLLLLRLVICILLSPLPIILYHFYYSFPSSTCLSFIYPRPFSSPRFPSFPLLLHIRPLASVYPFPSCFFCWLCAPLCINIMPISPSHVLMS